jgi:GNAT superfamily N-acetyltransferase
MSEIKVVVCDKSHIQFAGQVACLIEQAAQEPGVALARRPVKEIEDKIVKGDAVIALCEERAVGFCYVAIWEQGRFASHSGLVVAPEYRRSGLAKKLKNLIFEVTRKKYPDAEPFGITMSSAIMRTNSSLGYVPVGYQEITNDQKFWDGCQTCPYHKTLIKMQRKICFCTAMKFPKTQVK